MDSITHFLKDYSSSLIHSPSPIPGSSEPKCIYYKEYTQEQPTYTVIIPIHNQENIIIKNLNSVLKYTGGSYEFILILDSCSDSTETLVMNWIQTIIIPAKISRTIIIHSDTPLFETSCDNIGFLLGRGDYFLEIQADMEMIELDYNIILTKPFIQYNNVIGVSGRCSHNFKGHNGSGRLAELIAIQHDSKYSNTNFYVNETCNRGPLLLDAKKLKELQYLDEHNYYLDNSDHDLFARAYDQYKYICGYVPIQFISPIADGSTRKPRNAINTEYLMKRRQRGGNGYLDSLLKRGYIERDPVVLPLN